MRAGVSELEAEHELDPLLDQASPKKAIVGMLQTFEPEISAQRLSLQKSQGGSPKGGSPKGGSPKHASVLASAAAVGTPLAASATPRPGEEAGARIAGGTVGTRSGPGFREGAAGGGTVASPADTKKVDRAASPSTKARNSPVVAAKLSICSSPTGNQFGAMCVAPSQAELQAQSKARRAAKDRAALLKEGKGEEIISVEWKKTLLGKMGATPSAGWRTQFLDLQQKKYYKEELQKQQAT